MKFRMKTFSAVVLAGCMLAGIVGCSGTETTYYDNETDPIVFSTQEVDKVFNPFFSTSATDSNVVGMTQIGMLSNDEEGQVAYGDDEAVVTKDLQIVTEGEQGKDQTTTYYFVLKNNVRFSNGSYLTIKDVLFNLYIYLDPVYAGSSTIYSTEIVGLQEYRTQASTEAEQNSFMQKFELEASARINALAEVADEIVKDNSGLSETQFRAKLVQYTEEKYAGVEAYKNLAADFDKMCELFKEELESDYSNYIDTYEDTTFSDSNGVVYKNLFTTDVEVFLYNEGYITWSKKEGKLSSSLTNNVSDLKNWSKETAINTVYADKVPDSTSEIVQYWATATSLYDYITNEALETYFKTHARTYTNISGIQFANRTQSVKVNNVTYDVPTYNADGAVTEGNEVLSIKINGVDPKAIWNFSFAVAPMYYYSDAEHIAKFDYEANFGVEYGSQTFMNNVVKNPDKIGVPVGAGPYAASKSSGGIENISSGDFYSLGVIYFERNPYYIMGAPTIKKMRFQVVSASQMLNTLYSGEVDFAEPNAKPETIDELNGKKSQGIGNQSIQTSGYGYIGINAGKVPSLKVRQAIMHAINTQECVNYYKTTAEAIHRSMSRSSWAYPDNATPYYPYIGGAVPENLDVVNPDYKDFVIRKGKKTGDTFTEAEQIEFITGLVEEAGYTVGGNGVYVSGSNTLKYTFTIAGDETDHPAWDALSHAAELLNKCNFDVFVTTDSNALSKLTTGSLTVWAAAWGSTIDPDMYQVYHKDSSATSVLNWGYKQILRNAGGKYDTELAIVEELSELIELARTSTDNNPGGYRAQIYSQALDLVMQLAIELPTYQRDDLFAYNANKIDASTFFQNASPFKGLTADLYSISLVTER